MTSHSANGMSSLKPFNAERPNIVQSVVEEGVLIVLAKPTQLKHPHPQRFEQYWDVVQ